MKKSSFTDLPSYISTLRKKIHTKTIVDVFRWEGSSGTRSVCEEGKWLTLEKAVFAWWAGRIEKLYI